MIYCVLIALLFARRFFLPYQNQVNYLHTNSQNLIET